MHYTILYGLYVAFATWPGRLWQILSKIRMPHIAACYTFFGSLAEDLATTRLRIELDTYNISTISYI